MKSNHILLQCFIEEKCNQGQAYHSGMLLADDSNVVDEKECLEKCNSEDSCKFWDFGEGWCRLRTDAGNGPQVDNKYTSGPKNCIFESHDEIGNLEWVHL